MNRSVPLPTFARSLAMALLLLTASTRLLSARESGVVPIPFAIAPANDSADVVAVVARFHAALSAGDSATVLTLLAEDVVILESGGVETRDDYRAHHLPADIEFAKAVPSSRGSTRVQIRGDVAWVSGTSATQGDFRGRPINSSGAEFVVLTREGAAWKIRAIHWSSRAKRQ